MRTIPKLAAAATALALLLANPVLAEDRAAEKPRLELASFGLIGLPINHKVRIAVVQGRRLPGTTPVELRLLDANGRLLLRERAAVGAGRPAIAELRREDAPGFGPLLVQAQVVVATRSDGPSVPSDFTCPLNITVQTVSGDEDDGPVLGCNVNACKDPTGGQGSTGGVSAICTLSVVDLTL